MKRLLGLAMVIVLLFAPVVYGTEKVNINTATKAELEKLPQIGDVVAERIIKYREKHEGFKSIEELTKVKGIGKKKFEKIKDLVTIGETKQ